jgi:hypothetical protein
VLVFDLGFDAWNNGVSADLERIWAVEAGVKKWWLDDRKRGERSSWYREPSQAVDIPEQNISKPRMC